jgi:outer membrane protein
MRCESFTSLDVHQNQRWLEKRRKIATFEKIKTYMKKLIGLLLLLIFLQNINAQKYGYLNKEELYMSMPDYDSATVQVEKLRKEFENQLAAMQNELSIKTTSLNNESANISEFLRKNRQEELNNLNVRIQLFSVKATSQLEDKKNQFLQPIIARVDNAIKAVAEEQGFIFVIDGGQLFYTDEKKCTNILPLVKAKLAVR